VIPRRTSWRSYEGSILVVSLAVLLAASVLAFSGAYQIWAARRFTEKVSLHKLVQAVAASAFEESCARLEKTGADLPAPAGAFGRQLKEILHWTDGMRSAVPRTRALFGDQGATPEDVSVRSSNWVLEVSAFPDRSAGLIREVAVLELSTVVQIRTDRTVLKARATVRRFAAARVEPGERRARLDIQRGNLYLTVAFD
jgi:hypothetical protein